MLDKQYKGAPFGTQTARFDVAGIHPKSKFPGTFTQVAYCPRALSEKNVLLGPGKYNVDLRDHFGDAALLEKSSGPGWARAYEVQRMAQLPHLLHKEQWELKKLLKRKLGPGSYQIKDFLELADGKPRSTHGICETRDIRFKASAVKDTLPGPGTYGKGGIPHSAVEEKEKKSASNVGLLDAGSNARNLPQVGSHLGPGNYNFKSFTDDMEKRVVSLRGPYDMFTGDRNKPIKIGHRAAPIGSNLGPGQYDVKSFSDEHRTEHRVRQGRFGKVDQYPEKPAERLYAFTLAHNPRKGFEPAPAQYDPVDPNVKPPTQSHNAPPFLSSSVRTDKNATKYFTGNHNPVGAGRYDVQKFDEAQHVNGFTHLFKSKSTRPDASKTSFFNERIRAKDMRPQDRVFLLDPDNPKDVLRRNVTLIENNKVPQQMRAARALTVAY